MLSLGKKVRLSRLFDAASGRTLVVTLDQGLARGVMPGIERIKEVMGRLVEGRPNAMTMHKGLAEHCFYDYADRVSLILKCTSFSQFHPNFDAWLATVDEAVRLGADAIAMGVLLGTEEQPQMLQNLAALSREAALAGMPLIAHIYPKGVAAEHQHDLENIAYCARVGAELGVDVVKTWWTGSAETFSKVVEACPARVVVAGGPKLDDPAQVLRTVREIVDSGAAGLAFGRNVWQYHDPVAMIRALKVIVHGNGTVQEAEAELLRTASV